MDIFMKISGEEDADLLLDTLFAYSVSKNVLLVQILCSFEFDF